MTNPAAGRAGVSAGNGPSGRLEPWARTRARRGWPAWLAASACGLLLLVAPGCQGSAALTTQSRGLPQAIDPLLLRSELHLAMDRSMAKIVGTASQIAADTQDRRIRELCLYWKIRSLDNYLDIVKEDDPRLAFLHEWFSVVRLRQYLTEGAGKDSFGPDQAKAVAMAKGIEEDILALGRRAFSPAAIEAAQDDIEASAIQYRSQGPFDPQALPPPEAEGDLLAILKLPLIPLTSLQGVNNTAEAINRFTDTVQDFTAVIQHLPERTRWQSELLLLEMEATGPAAVLVRQLDSFEKEMREVFASVKTLPQEVRAEFEKSLDALEKAHPQLQATLKEARATVEQAQQTVVAARQGIVDFRQTAETAGKASDQFTQTAKAFDAAAMEVRGLLTEYRQWTGTKESQVAAEAGASQPVGTAAPSATREAPAEAADEEPPQKSPDIQDYRAAADSIATAAKELRSTLGELKQPLPPQSSIHEMAGEALGVIDSLFWRGVTLVAVIFALALAYRWLGRAFTKKGNGQQATGNRE
jgi:hypothetical protein